MATDVPDTTTIVTYLESASAGLLGQEALTILGATINGLRVVSLQFEHDPNCRMISAPSARKFAHMLLAAAKEPG